VFFLLKIIFFVFLGEIDAETFSLTNQHLQEKMTAIECKIDYDLTTKSNLEIMIDDSLMMASQLNLVWDRSDLENKKIMSSTLLSNVSIKWTKKGLN
jgi:hypothetical protein